ncbi:MAG: class I SAM-dependent methyltransferase [Parvularculaceae bacterium]|nr:class I SAM-dependent methyltransferase [Parvularculaceae bacterium]
MRYLRYQVFQSLKAPFAEFSRRSRMKKFCQKMAPHEGAKVLDLGGTAAIWAFVDTPLNIKILNLPGSPMNKPPSVAHHNIEFVVGDATDLKEFEDGEFDIVFSNSVIEHVGGRGKQLAFAEEVKRLAPAYWVQTPSIWFPIEAHSGMPFWFFYPRAVRNWFMARWSQKLPAWTEMVRQTRVLKHIALRFLFHDGHIDREWSFLMVKSYIAYKPRPQWRGDLRRRQSAA